MGGDIMKRRGIGIFLIIILIFGAGGSVWYFQYGRDLLKKVNGLSKTEYLECKNAKDYNTTIDDLMKKDEFKNMSVDERGKKVAKYLKQMAILNKKDDTDVGLKENAIQYYSEMGAVVYMDDQDHCNIIWVNDANDLMFSGANTENSEIYKMDNISAKNVSDDTDDTDEMNILLLYGAEHDNGMQDYINILTKYEEDENLNINLEVDDEVTVEDYMSKLDSAYMVIIASHGMYGVAPGTWFSKYTEETPMISTNEIVNRDNRKKYKEQLDNHYVVMSESFANIGSRHYIVLPELFEASYTENALQGEMIYITACEALGKYEADSGDKYDTSMVQSLLDCGASSVLAYHNSVFKDYSFYMFDSILASLIDENTLSVAVDKAKEINGADQEEFARINGELDDEYKKKNPEAYEMVLEGIGNNKAVIGVYGDEEYCINVKLQNNEAEQIDAQSMWIEFLTSGEYQKLINEYNYEWETASDIMEACEDGYRYALSDLNGDGIDELLLEKTQCDGGEWKYTWTFAISDGSIICTDERYGFDSFRKSGIDNTIFVSSITRPSADYYQYDFYKMEGNQYVNAYSIIKDYDHIYYDYGTTTKDIENKAEELDNLEDFNWKYLEEDNQQNVSIQHTPDNKNIPEDAVTYNGHSYYCFDNGIQTWLEAESYCESLGGHLAVIEDADKNTFLYNYMLSCGYESAYFGYSDLEEEGTWVWVDGNSTYSNWAVDEPNNDDGDEDYAMFFYKYTDGKWNDGSFINDSDHGGRAFICEW